MEAIHNNISIKNNNNKKNWRRVKIFNKTYRLNPVAERRYKTTGEFLTLMIGIMSIIFLYVILAV